MVTTGIIMFVTAAVAALIGIMQLIQKGPLLNNAWLYANEERRRIMNKKPYYIQSGIVFLMIGIAFGMIGLFCVTKERTFLYAEYAVMGIVLVYAIVSSIAIAKKNKR